MDKICPTCAADPTSHSFKKVAEKAGITIYYSHPSKAKRYDDSDGILKHVDNLLALNGNKRWSCILDGDGFDLKHAAEVSTGVGLMKLLMTKYGATMEEFKIINPTWHIQGMMKLAKVTLEPGMFAKVHLMDDRKHSVLEFI
jgi:hypothetical protein